MPAGATIERPGRATVWFYLAWLATFCVEGPLRGGLFAAGLPNLLYARDLVAVGGLALSLAAPFVSRRSPPPGLVLMTWLLAVHMMVGLLLGGTLFQRLFGVKIFIAVLYSAAIFPTLRQHWQLFQRGMAVFFCVSVLGVFANWVIGEMPWEGMSYQTAFGSVQTTRQWWISGGVRRLPGLARASFDAAMIIGLTGTLLLALTRSAWLRVLVAVAGMATILLTTSKGMVLAYGVAAVWLVPTARSAASLTIGRLIVAALMLLTCLVPTLFMVISVPEHSTEIPELLSSLWDRFSWMWPSAYALLPDGYGALTGVGPGGIGTALDYPVPLAVPNSGDSIFVYYFATFGLLGIMYVAFPIWAILRPEAKGDPLAFVWAGLLVITYGYGLSISMVEQTFFAGVFGLLYGAAFAPREPAGVPS